MINNMESGLAVETNCLCPLILPMLSSGYIISILRQMAMLPLDFSGLMCQTVTSTRVQC